MNPLSEAIRKRRMASAPPENSMADLVASLSPEQKSELFEVLKGEMSEGQEPQSEQMEDQTGELNQTPGEKGELNMQIANEMNDPNMDLEKEPSDFIERAKQRVTKMMKGKGY